MSPSRSPGDPLQQLLDEAQSELSRRLREACEAEARGVASESTAEIRRLEDTLLAAAMAAGRAVAARRHLQDAAHHDAAASPDHGAAPDEQVTREPTGGTVREFEDETGRGWRAWPVIPDASRTHLAGGRSLGEFRDGWICFEALDQSGRRRLPGWGRRWSDLPQHELPRLLAQALAVPARKGRPPQDAGGASESDAH